MTLIAILAGLLLERWLGSFESWRRYELVQIGLNNIKKSLNFIPSQYLLVLYLVIPALILIYIELKIGAFLFFFLSLLILIFTIGPRDLESQVESLIEAWYRGDRAAINWHASDLIGDHESSNTPEMIRRVISTTFQESLRRYFGVIFWFIVLGAAGALFYRMLQILAESGENDEPWLQPFYGMLSWPPCRLLAFSFGLAGSFVDVAHGLRQFTAMDMQTNMKTVERCGFGSLQLRDDSFSGFDNDLINHVVEAMALIRRAMMVWLAVLAIGVLSGWTL